LNRGKLIDLGCGPGQTTKYLSDCGLTDILGIDISPQMITVAKNINPQLHFDTADILNLKYPDKFFSSAIAFYSIVHFDYGQIKSAFKEIKRVLSDKGQFLFSFHFGNNVVHLDEFLGNQVNIDFYFFETSKITDLLIEIGFEIVNVIEHNRTKMWSIQADVHTFGQKTTTANMGFAIGGVTCPDALIQDRKVK